MAFLESQQVDVRKELIDTALKGFAVRMYKLKAICAVSTTGAWRNDFFRASPDTLVAGGTTQDVAELARGEAFP